MRMGFTMRQQVVAAIHAKVLRLNSAAVAHANSGTIINLASNDVRRFDEGFSFWLFCWAGPLEAAMVLLMVSLELGFVPAICGMAAMLAVIPLQVGCCGCLGCGGFLAATMFWMCLVLCITLG
jgi:predicted nicotinamide N-methyase